MKDQWPLCHTTFKAGTWSGYARDRLGKDSLEVLLPSQYIGDKFGESLGGRQAPPNFWKVPGLPHKFPELRRKFLGDFPGSSLTVELNSNAEVPRKFPRLPRKFPGLPQKLPELPRRSAPFSGKPDTLSRITKAFFEYYSQKREIELLERHETS